MLQELTEFLREAAVTGLELRAYFLRSEAYTQILELQRKFPAVRFVAENVVITYKRRK